MADNIMALLEKYGELIVARNPNQLRDALQ